MSNVAAPRRRFRGPAPKAFTALGLLAIGLALGCSGRPPARAAADTLSTRERQEAVGHSGLPGATGINRALEVADSATARNRVLDSIGRP